jgi:ribonucleoside-triphosphate reductase
MDKGLKFLSDLVFARTYAAKKPDGYKETWEEAVQRVIGMHCAKFPHLEAEIRATVEKPMLEKWVVPSMRSLQFAGGGVEREGLRMFNCSAIAMAEFRAFAEIFYVLMCGCGAGFSVKNHHVAQLPKIPEKGRFEVFRIPDSKEGWADSVLKMFENPWVVFDYSDIRPAGSPLSTGGTASGPEALMKLHEKMDEILLNALGRQLTPTEASDIVCHIADGVVVGGVRRAALICLFDTEEMLTYKSGAWWEKNPQRGRANVSYTVMRDDPRAKEKFIQIMDACFASGSGEPGLVFSNDPELLVNPCCEISLRNRGLCNLTEINWPAVHYNHQFYTALHAAVALGCLQASYTDFGYVHSDWKKNADEEALLGVSITGQAEGWDELITTIDVPNFKETVDYLTDKWAKLVGINPPKRTLTTKPSGTTSALLGTTSGIHAAHSEFYIRRVRVDISHPLAIYLAGLSEFKPFIELDKFNPSNYVISIPVQKVGAVTRSQESALDLLDRMKKINELWVSKGHYSGGNQHNVSLTVSYKPEEEAGIKEWMWNNRNVYCGVSLLPYDGGTYVQAPFQEIDKETYERLTAAFPQIDLSGVNFGATADERMGEQACGANGCELV